MNNRTLDDSIVLVTGAGGFLAQYIIPKLLSRGAEVVGVDLREGLGAGRTASFKSKARLLECDVTDYSAVEKIGTKCDYIIHLAAIAAPIKCELNPDRAFIVNVQGTFNILKFAKESKAKKFVFASTAHVYGISPKYTPTDEKHPLALQDTYTTTKILGESLCQLFYSNHNLRYSTLRLFNGYGPGQSGDYFIPAMISKAKKGSIVLTGRRVTKDFVYAEDIADAFSRALVSDFVGEVNIGSGKQTTLEFVAQHIADALGAKLSFAPTDPSGPTHMQCDAARAGMVLGWKARTSIEAGLDETVRASRKG